MRFRVVALAMVLIAFIAPVSFAVSFDRSPRLAKSESIASSVFLDRIPETLRLFIVGAMLVGVAVAARRTAPLDQ